LTIRWKQIEKLFAICILTSFMGQLYLNPFSTGFRFSFSVVVLSLLLIYFKDTSTIIATSSVGITIALFRAFVYMMGHPGTSWWQMLNDYYPVAMFYILFGIMFEILNVRDKINTAGQFCMALWFCDSISNIVEVVLRREWAGYPFEKVILVIIIMGFIRSLVTICIYYVTAYYMSRYERERKENKYREMVMFIASLKAELFFLRKSMYDIENAMNESYALYEELQGSSLRDNALSVAKDIHEIKKDYLRVVTGIEKTLSEENHDFHMSLKDIFIIIKENTEKLIEAKNKHIILRFRYSYNFVTGEFYQLISVLNNLIINSIDAIENVGIINIIQETSEEYCTFKVIDNGRGIEREDLELVFEPGFSTKFNHITGEMSTGIGLTHVKHIVEDYFQGEIRVNSEENTKTVFEIIIPIKNIMYGKW